MKAKNSQFIIIGGGISGSIAAYVCSKLNRNAIWFCPENEVVQGAIQVPPNSIKFLKNIGCFEILKKYLTPISMIRVRDQYYTQDLASINVDQKYYTIDRKKLFLTIKDQIENDPNIVTLDEKVISFTNTSNECKCISSSGNEYISEFILGADGASGIIRNNLIYNRNKNINKKYIFRGVVEKNKGNKILFQSAINLWLDDGWHIVYYPFSNGNYLNIILVGKNSVKNLEKSNNVELSLLKEINWQHFIYENDIDEIIFNNGKVFLIGDAAHPIQPHLAQGAAQILNDGSVLLEKLSKNGDTFSNLQEYSMSRSRECIRIRDLSFFTGKGFSSKGAIAKARNKLILASNNYLQELIENIWE